MIKKLILSLLCTLLVFSTTVSYAASGDSSPNTYTFTDDAGHLTTLAQEDDGTIMVYLDGKLNHSAKTDLNSDTITFKQYNSNESTMLSSDYSVNTKLLKASDYYVMEDDTNKQNQDENPMTINLNGYNYHSSYTDTFVTGLTAKGYIKSEPFEYTSVNKVSFVRSTAIGVAASIIVSLFSGGITVGIVVGALIGAFGSVIADGYFTRDVDGKVHYELRWASWKGVVNDWELTVRKGEYYLRTVSDLSNKIDVRKADNKAPAGYQFDFTTFLQDTISKYTNR